MKQTISEAAIFNARILRKLQKALADDPETEITTLLPSNYSTRLTSRKTVKGERYLVFLRSITNELVLAQEAAPSTPPEAPNDRNSLICFPAKVVHALSDLAGAVLGFRGNAATLSNTELTVALVNALDHGEIIWRA